MNKKMTLRTAIVSIIVLVILLMTSNNVHAISDWEGEYFTYGAGLSETQIKETERLLGIEDKDIERIKINAEDYNKYTGLTTKDSSLYSSAIIVKGDKGSGVNVYINTPGNITKIKDHQYMNAAITSGITDSDIIVASPVQVTGESALAGIYKALAEAGVEINDEAAQVANEELTMVKEVSEDNEISEDSDLKELSLAIADIKERIAALEDRDSLTREEVIALINEVLDERGLTLSDGSKVKIADWALKFKGLDIDWTSIGNSLKDFGSTIADKATDLYDWGQESGFFAKIWDAIKAFFNTLFGSSNN